MTKFFEILHQSVGYGMYAKLRNIGTTYIEQWLEKKKKKEKNYQKKIIVKLYKHSWLRWDGSSRSNLFVNKIITYDDQKNSHSGQIKNKDVFPI